MSNDRVLTLSDGTRYRQDARGFIDYLGAREEVTTTVREDVRVDDNPFEWRQVTSIIPHTSVIHRAPAEFTSQPIENFNFPLFCSLFNRTSFGEGMSAYDEFEFVINQYNDTVASNPTMRHMGNTQRVFISEGICIRAQSNRSRRRRRFTTNQHQTASNIFAGTALVDSLNNRYGEEEITTQWPTHSEGAWTTPDTRPRQLRMKTCLHKGCIRCFGKSKDGRGKDCFHNYECHCVECQP